MFDEQIGRIPAQGPRDTDLLPGLSLRSIFSRNYVLPLFFLGMFILMPLTIFSSDPKMQLESKGKTTQGHVTAVDYAGTRGDDLRISYSFTPPGEPEYRGSCHCSKGAAYYNVKVGDAVPVRYLPSKPSVNDLEDDPHGANRPPIFFFLIFPFFGLLFFGFFVWPHFKELIKARSIFKSGQFTKGLILFVKRTNPSWPDYTAPPSQVFLTYRLPSGQDVEGKTLCGNAWLLNHLAPGAEVNIAYSSTSPEDVVLLDAYIR